MSKNYEKKKDNIWDYGENTGSVYTLLKQRVVQALHATFINQAPVIIQVMPTCC